MTPFWSFDRSATAWPFGALGVPGPQHVLQLGIVHRREPESVCLKLQGRSVAKRRKAVLLEHMVVNRLKNVYLPLLLPQQLLLLPLLPLLLPQVDLSKACVVLKHALH